MVELRRVCVFCGSSSGAHPDYSSAARSLGQLLVEQRVGLVYGGANVGLMGAVANSVLEAGGDVIGVIPKHLEAREIAHKGLSDLRVVNSMHERKSLMADLSDAFIALPGGLGTLEELLEVATWTQLGIHEKPLGILNVRGYYDPLGALLRVAVTERFLREDHRALIAIEEEPDRLLATLRAFAPSRVDKWLDRSER